jgi:branched-subunit amino acid aminotransferase/4-amino-4-deoxychorismate lyase
VKQGHDDAILVRDTGKKIVTEGTRSNVFAVKKGKVYTAPEGNLILSGITRAKILELCRTLGIGVVEAFQTPEFFLKADEVFFTSATGPVPITKIGDKPIPAGPVFERLLKAYREFLDSLTS